MKSYEDLTKPGKQIVWAEKVNIKKLPDEVIRKHSPQPDSMKVQYPDGEVKFLPPEVFEKQFKEIAD